MLDIGFGSNEYVHHFWMQSFTQLIAKHKRYLKSEGESRYMLGLRTYFLEILKSPFKEFRHSFFEKQGYKDLGTGFILSILWAWYQTYARIKLYRFQKMKQL